MTNMIYRGAKHDGQRSIQPRTAAHLIYRGARHDGLSTETSARPLGVEMRYRGVRYTVAVHGVIAGIGRTLTSAGLIGVTPQVA
jgi:hypothetical protein